MHSLGIIRFPWQGWPSFWDSSWNTLKYIFNLFRPSTFRLFVTDYNFLILCQISTICIFSSRVYCRHFLMKSNKILQCVFCSLFICKSSRFSNINKYVLDYIIKYIVCLVFWQSTKYLAACFPINMLLSISWKFRMHFFVINTFQIFKFVKYFYPII